MKKLLYILCQWTWGLPQSLAGLAVFLACRGGKHYMSGGAAASRWKSPYSLSMGMFVFLSERLEGAEYERMLRHEYGHTIQSLILGPLYLPVIALPSAIWCRLPYFEKLRKEKNISYYSFYTERWADILGGNTQHKLNKTARG